MPAPARSPMGSPARALPATIATHPRAAQAAAAGTASFRASSGAHAGNCRNAPFPPACRGIARRDSLAAREGAMPPMTVQASAETTAEPAVTSTARAAPVLDQHRFPEDRLAGFMAREVAFGSRLLSALPSQSRAPPGPRPCSTTLPEDRLHPGSSRRSSRLCSTLPSDPASRRRPCASLGTRHAGFGPSVSGAPGFTPRLRLQGRSNWMLCRSA